MHVQTRSHKPAGNNADNAVALFCRDLFRHFSLVESKLSQFFLHHMFSVGVTFGLGLGDGVARCLPEKKFFFLNNSILHI